VINDYAVSEQMSFNQIIGVLEFLKLEYYRMSIEEE